MSRRDTFLRPDAPTGLGTPSDGGSAWVPLLGTLGVAGHQGYAPAAPAAAVLETGLADVVASLTLATPADNAELIFRVVDENNWWVAVCRVTGSALTLWKRSGGAWTNVGSAALPGGASWSAGDTITAACSGSTIHAYRNGVSLITASDAYNAAVTRHGLYLDNGVPRVAAFVAVDPATPATAYTLTGPPTATVGAAAGPFTVIPLGAVTGTITLTPSGGGLTTPVVLTFSSSAVPQTFTLTPTTAGTVTLTATNSAGISPNPPNFTCTAVLEYTTTGAGTDWGTAANWTPTGPPAAGSVVLVNHPMTVGATTGTIVGASTPGLTCLTLNADLDCLGSLEVRGNVVQAGSANFTGHGGGTLLFNPGFTVPASTAWSWQVGAGQFRTTGTSDPARFRVESAAGGGHGYFTSPSAPGSGNVNLAYADILRIGDVNNPAFSVNYSTGSAVLALDHCVLYQCGVVYANFAAGTTGGQFSVTNCVSLGCLNGTVAGHGGSPVQALGAPPGAGPWRLANLDCDTNVVLNSIAPWVLAGNTYRAGGFDFTTGADFAATAGPFPARYLTLTGPPGGVPTVASRRFTASLRGGTTGTATLTPTAAGVAGTFSPSSLSLTGAAAGTFTFTPSGTGQGRVAVTSTGVAQYPDGSGASLLLLDAVPFSAETTAVLYTLTPPPAPYGIAGRPSGPFVVALPPGQTVPSGVTVTPADGGAGGTFTPTTVTLAGSTAGAAATFTYTPAAAAALVIACTNTGSLADPAPAAFTAQRSFDQALALWEEVRLGTAPGEPVSIGGNAYGSTSYYGFPAGRADLDAENHYDPFAVYWRLQFAYPDYDYSVAIDAARYQYRDLWLHCNGGLPASWHPTAYGVRYDWEQLGDTESWATLLFQYDLNDFYNDYTTFWPASRPEAFALEQIINCERLGVAPVTGMRSPYATKLQEATNYQFSYVDAWLSDPAKTNLAGDTYSPCIAVQCFMCGLSMATLIAFWDHYRAAPYLSGATTPGAAAYQVDSTIADMAALVPARVKALLDYLSDACYTLSVLDWGDGSGAPASGTSLVAAGVDNTGLLHVRAFDPRGVRFLDLDETGFPPERSAAVAALRAQLPLLAPSHTLTAAERARTLEAVMTLCGKNCWYTDGLCWPYWDRDTKPLDPAFGGSCGALGYDGGGQPYPSPELNPSIGFAFAWYAWYSKEVLGQDAEHYGPYLRRYEESAVGAMAARGGGTLATTSTAYFDPIAYQKQFNQSFGTGELYGRDWRSRILTPSAWAAPAALALDLPDGDTGRANQLSGRVRAQLTPQTGKGIDFPGAVTVTPADGGAGGTFLPKFAVLTALEPLACFRYAPAAAAAGTTVSLALVVADASGTGLSPPAHVSYHVTTVAPFATGVTLTAPASAHGPTQFSPDYVLALDPPGSVPPRAFDPFGGMVSAYPGAAVTAGGGTGATIIPGSRLALSGETPSRPFQVHPGGGTAVILQVSFPAFTGWSSTPVVHYTPLVANTGADYAVTLAASSGPVGAPVAGVVSVTASLFAGVAVTQSDGAGGTFSPNPVKVNGGYRSSAFTYTPAAPGPQSFAASNASGLANPTGVEYTATGTGDAGAYTLTGPGSGLVLSASTPFWVAPGGAYTGSITVTPAGGGLSTPVVLTWAGTGEARFFTITPTAVGVVTLTPTSSPQLGTDPAPKTYAVSAPALDPPPVPPAGGSSSAVLGGGFGGLVAGGGG